MQQSYEKILKQHCKSIGIWQKFRSIVWKILEVLKSMWFSKYNTIAIPDKRGHFLLNLSLVWYPCKLHSCYHRLPNQNLKQMCHIMTQITILEGGHFYFNLSITMNLISLQVAFLLLDIPPLIARHLSLPNQIWGTTWLQVRKPENKSDTFSSHTLIAGFVTCMAHSYNWLVTGARQHV